MSYILAVTKAGRTLITEKYYSGRYNKKGIERSINHKKHPRLRKDAISARQNEK